MTDTSNTEETDLRQLLNAANPETLRKIGIHVALVNGESNIVQQDLTNNSNRVWRKPTAIEKQKLLRYNARRRTQHQKDLETEAKQSNEITQHLPWTWSDSCRKWLQELDEDDRRLMNDESRWINHPWIDQLQ